MGQKHWLDPLARRLLIATGQLPQGPPARRVADAGADTGRDTGTAAVERELLALKLRQQPGRRLQNPQEVQLAAELGWRLDVNRATATDWLRLPGITADQVDLLIRLQAGGVQLSGSDDLARLLELPASVIASWQPLLDYRWYGEPPAAPAAPQLDLNQAHDRQLQTLGLSTERRARLLRERARRPFQDLADLQLRVQLPPALIESWIGRVCFRPAQAGPKLPRPGQQA
jgi:DNA uptake protein ComE-like DNA-binding protein